MMPLSNSRVFVARWLDSLAGAVASVLFPSGCRICEALLTREDRLPVCDACLKSFRELPGEICERCGQPWGGRAAMWMETRAFARNAGSADSRLTLRGVSGLMTGRWPGRSC